MEKSRESRSIADCTYPKVGKTSWSRNVSAVKSQRGGEKAPKREYIVLYMGKKLKEWKTGTGNANAGNLYRRSQNPERKRFVVKNVGNLG
jgi:hypothetical protein